MEVKMDIIDLKKLGDDGLSKLLKDLEEAAA